MIVRIEEFIIKKSNMERIQVEMVEQKSRMSVLKALLVIVESSQFSGVLAKEDKDKVN